VAWETGNKRRLRTSIRMAAVVSNEVIVLFFTWLTHKKKEILSVSGKAKSSVTTSPGSPPHPSDHLQRRKYHLKIPQGQ
jgi:hypothetical protein